MRPRSPVAEAGVWWAESTDLPGVVAEASTILVELNHVQHGPRVSIRLIADRTEAIELAA